MGIPKWTCFIVAWILLGVLIFMDIGVRIQNVVAGEGLTIVDFGVPGTLVVLLVVSIVLFREQRRKAQSRETDLADQ